MSDGKTQQQFPTSRRMSEYSQRNGKPNAHVVSDQKAGANKQSTNKQSTSNKTGGCGCGG